MSNQRYPEEFKIEAVKHITKCGLRVADVAERLGVSATLGESGVFTQHGPVADVSHGSHRSRAVI